MLNLTEKTLAMNNMGDWQLSKTDVFWGELACSEHVVQLYESDDSFLDMLAGFVGSGFNAGDSVILIATAAHLQDLEKRLKAHGIHVNSLVTNDQYIPLDAGQTLSQFMVDGMPDEALFMQLVTKVMKRARRNNRKVRAFGEMVALLWSGGQQEATIELENLWNKFCATESLCLFCAYPSNIFTHDAHNSINHICTTHTKIIDSTHRPMVEVFYKSAKQAPIINQFPTQMAIQP